MMKNLDSHCKLSIVIPVYRSAPMLPKLVEAVERAMSDVGLTDDFELLLINDASPDNSWAVIRSLATAHNFVRGITLRRNTGQHNATMAGLNYVRGSFVAVMDDDLQHPPEAIGNMMRALEEGYDVCYTRYVNRQHVWWKQMGSRFNDYAATLLLDKPKGLYLSSLKMMRREIAEEVTKYDGPYTYVDGLILDVTRSITAIDVTHHARYQGESNYDFSRLVSLWLKMATSFSIFPLRIATYLGFGLAGLSVVMVVFIIVMKILHPAYPAGWTSLISTILLIGGVQTLCIGVIGEYLGRTYLKLNRKRQFVVGGTTWATTSQHE